MKNRDFPPPAIEILCGIERMLLFKYITMYRGKRMYKGKYMYKVLRY